MIRRTKIVATIGPASSSESEIKKLILAGMNVARLNFSHGQHEDHQKVFDTIRKLSRELEAPVAILQDLQGPKIRVGPSLPAEGVELVVGNEIALYFKNEPNFSGLKVPVDFEPILSSSSEDTRVLFDDGLLEVRVIEVKTDHLVCKVVHGGLLKPRKGINVPGAHLDVECLTEKDLKDLEFGLSLGVDYIALSFVRQASDIAKLKALIAADKRESSHVKVVAKIEMLEALENLDEIIQLSDGVMVARGDLAVEVGQTQLPLLQKTIIERSNVYGRPVITATQMLDSMVHNPRPTRAEITDVANAVLDGSDALMLSAETAAGDHPSVCVSTMGEIIKEVETSSQSYFYDLSLEDEFLSVAQSIAASATLCSLKLNATAIICLSTTGKTATHISSFRPKSQVIAVTNKEETLAQMELVWGVQTLKISSYNSSEEVMEMVFDRLVHFGLVEPGDRVILTLGMPVKTGAKTNTLRVFTVPKKEPQWNGQTPLRFQNLPN